MYKGDNGYIYYDNSSQLATESFTSLFAGGNYAQAHYMKIEFLETQFNVPLHTDKYKLGCLARKAGEDPSLKESLRAVMDGDFNFNEGDIYTPVVFRSSGLPTSSTSFNMADMRNSFHSSSYNNISSFSYADKNFNYYSKYDIRYTLGGTDTPVITYSVQDLNEPIDNIKPSATYSQIQTHSYSPKLKPLVYTIQDKDYM